MPNRSIKWTRKEKSIVVGLKFKKIKAEYKMLIVTMYESCIVLWKDYGNCVLL